MNIALPLAAAIRLSSLFYGDNTEFFNPYRTGETLLGVNNRLTLEVPLGPGAGLELGVFTDQRAGGGTAFELVRPVVSLRLGSGRDQFIMGTLRTGSDGPHGLVPPLEVDTLSFTRRHENGLQWLHTGRLDQDVWLNWQQLNTTEHRERFDIGLRSRFRAAGPLHLAGQLHVVHEGGQLHDVGAVRDSFSGGPGIIIDEVGWYDRVVVQIYYLVSHDVPDRSRPGLDGHGWFIQAGWEKDNWRLTVIGCRQQHLVAWEGDANYRARKYREVLVSRGFPVTGGVRVDTAFRLHWIDGKREYSYRVIGTVDVSHRVGKK